MQDLRLAWRMLRKNPGFSLVVVLLLGVGMGIHLSVFALVNGIFRRPVPGITGRDELFIAGFQSPSSGSFRGTAYANYRDLRDQLAGALVLAGRTGTRVNLVAGDHALSVEGEQVTANYFDVLGMRPARGRFFLPSEDEALNRDRVVVISHRLSRELWAGDDAAVGREVTLNGINVRVVGVAPDGFHGAMLPGGRDIWLPFHLRQSGDSQSLTARDWQNVRMLYRPRPGVSPAEAQARIVAAVAELKRRFPAELGDRQVATGPYRGFESPGTASKPQLLLNVLSAGTALVMLIVCANLGNLVLARMAARRRDIALRIALGARRIDVLRPVIAEGLLLGLAASAVAQWLAAWGGPAILSMVPGDGGGRVDIAAGPGWDSFLYSLGIALVSALVFSLLPAWQSSRVDLIPALKPGEGGGVERGSRLRAALTIAQVALCLFLVVADGLILRSAQLVREQPDIDTARLLVFEAAPTLNGYSRPAANQLHERIAERVRALPGVAAAERTSTVPLQGMAQQRVWLPGQSREQARWVSSRVAGPGFLNALGVRLRDGRYLGEVDREGSERVVVVSQKMAREFWPAAAPVGQLVHLDGDQQPRRVVGVFEDYVNRIGDPVNAEFHLPLAQSDRDAGAFLVRAAGGGGAPEDLIPALRAAVREIDPALPLYNVRPMSVIVDEGMAIYTMPARVLSVAGGFSLVLAAIGLYSVLSFQVARRTREIGVRMALGAPARLVLAAVMRGGLLHAGTGLAIGLVLAAAGTRLIGGLLYGVSAADPVVFAVATLVLCVTSLAAIYLPARRATRIDPIRALRHE